jgi:hypothetical protein
MHTRLSAAAIAAVLLSGSGASGACLPGQTRGCVNLDIVPQISERIVAQEAVAPAAKSDPALEPKTPYTGPTVGIAPGVRRAPTVGYRWAIE